MKLLDRIDGRESNQFERVLRITRNIKNQLIIVSGLSFAAVGTAILGIIPIVRAPIAGFLLGLSGNLIVAVIIFLFLEQGIKSLHPITEIRNLPYSEFIENVRRAKKGDRIRILETFSSSINEYYTEFAMAIREAIKKGAEVEVLLFHPYSDGAKRRAEQLRERADVPEGIRKNLAHFYELESTIEYVDKKSLKVKLYTALPSIQMYRCGEWAYVSLFPIGERSDRSPNLKVPMDNPFGSYIDDTFEALWRGTDEAPTIPLRAHMRLQLDSPSPGLPSSGYFFAYDEREGYVDETCCFVGGESNPLYSSIFEFTKEKESVTFLLDNKKWCAEPHVLNPRAPNELDELTHALELIERRYGWDNRRLGPNPIILRFKNIKEVTD